MRNYTTYKRLNLLVFSLIMTLKGSNVSNRGLQPSALKQIWNIVWRSICSSVHSCFHVVNWGQCSINKYLTLIVFNLTVTLKGSNVSNRGLQPPAKKQIYTIVWRSICALANRMTNNYETQLSGTQNQIKPNTIEPRNNNPNFTFLTTLKGLNMHNPERQPGVMKQIWTIVWRSICALANRMTNNYSTPSPQKKQIN